MWSCDRETLGNGGESESGYELNTVEVEVYNVGDEHCDVSCKLYERSYQLLS